MKNWFSQAFGGKKGEPKPPGQSRTQEQRAGFPKPAECGPVDTRKKDPARTILAEPLPVASPPGQAENAVASEWRVGDVILGLYEVKQIHEGGGMGLVYSPSQEAFFPGFFGPPPVGDVCQWIHQSRKVLEQESLLI